jgi:hypothetical protein
MCPRPTHHVKRRVSRPRQPPLTDDTPATSSQQATKPNAPAAAAPQTRNSRRPTRCESNPVPVSKALAPSVTQPRHERRKRLSRGAPTLAHRAKQTKPVVASRYHQRSHRERDCRIATEFQKSTGAGHSTHARPGVWARASLRQAKTTGAVEAAARLLRFIPPDPQQSRAPHGSTSVDAKQQSANSTRRC